MNALFLCIFTDFTVSSTACSSLPCSVFHRLHDFRKCLKHRQSCYSCGRKTSRCSFIASPFVQYGAFGRNMSTFPPFGHLKRECYLTFYATVDISSAKVQKSNFLYIVCFFIAITTYSVQIFYTLPHFDFHIDWFADLAAQMWKCT